jgi:hypothetical protein
MKEMAHILWSWNIFEISSKDKPPIVRMHRQIAAIIRVAAASWTGICEAGQEREAL